MAIEAIRWIKKQDDYLYDGVETSYQTGCDLVRIREESQEIISKLQNQSLVDSELLDAWQDNIQETILLELYALLQKESISLDERLVIVLRGDGCLEAQDHCQACHINELLARNQDLKAKMKLMASLALIQRGVDNLNQATLLFAAESESQQGIFQACLRGSLSHFHLLTKN